MCQEAAEFIRSRTPKTIEIGMILGTGLGSIAEQMKDAITISYRDIPHFPVSTVHQGNLVIGTLGGKTILCMQGRVHYYEGYTMQEIVFPIHVMHALGIRILLLTNASGGICEDYFPGQVVSVSDHIKFDLESPLRGKNLPELGERFFDMTRAYSPRLRAHAQKAAEELGISLPEGVYAYMGGPQFETPAEIRMLRILGADLVGMSTVPEVIASVHSGIEVMTLSCVTNMAAGMDMGGFDKAVIASAEQTGRETMAKLLIKVVETL